MGGSAAEDFVQTNQQELDFVANVDDLVCSGTPVNTDIITSTQPLCPASGDLKVCCQAQQLQHGCPLSLEITIAGEAQNEPNFYVEDLHPKTHARLCEAQANSTSFCLQSYAETQRAGWRSHEDSTNEQKLMFLYSRKTVSVKLLLESALAC